MKCQYVPCDRDATNTMKDAGGIPREMCQWHAHIYACVQVIAQCEAVLKERRAEAKTAIERIDRQLNHLTDPKFKEPKWLTNTTTP